MAGVDVAGGRGRRGEAPELGMVPLIDLLFVTIAFLLITAVWTQQAALNASAIVPGSDAPCGDCVPQPEKQLHVYLEPAGFRLSWQEGARVLTESRVEGDLDALGERLVDEWQTYGSHTDPADGRRDACVLHADNHMPYRELAAVIDTVYGAKRDYATAEGQAERHPVFAVAFASR